MAEANPPLDVTRGLPLMVELKDFDEADRILDMTGWIMKAFIRRSARWARVTKTPRSRRRQRKGHCPLQADSNRDGGAALWRRLRD